MAWLKKNAALLRSEKHAAETHWSTAVKQQEEKYLKLQTEQENLKLLLGDLQSSLKECQQKEAVLRAEAENSKADLFQAITLRTIRLISELRPHWSMVA